MRTALSEKFLEKHSRRMIINKTLKVDEGVEIYLCHNLPEENRTPNSLVHLVLVHELGFYHRRFSVLINELLKKMGNDIGLTYFDYRGHGLSSGKRGKMQSLEDFTKDLIKVINKIPVKDKLNNKIFLLGEGVGALVSLKVVLEEKKLLENPISGLCMINPLVRFKNKFKNGNIPNIIKLNKIFNPFMNDLVSSNQEMYNIFLLDSLNQKNLSRKLVDNVVQSTEEIRFLSYYIDIPTLFVLSKDDQVADFNTSLLYAQGIEEHKREVVVFENEGHNILWGSKVELLAQDVSAWLKRGETF